MLRKLVEPTYIEMLYEMGFSDEDIRKRINKRFRLTLLFLIMGLFLALDQEKLYLYFISIGLPFIIYKNEFWSLKRDFEKFSIEREIAFTSFRNLIMSYLKADNNDKNLHTIFNKLNKRMHPTIQPALFQLMNEIIRRPNAIEPYKEFARKCSNNDDAINFMMCLYDFQHSSMELSVLEELSENANKRLLKLVNEVIKIKNKKVSSLPMFVAIGCVLIVVPYLVSTLMSSLKASGLFNM